MVGRIGWSIVIDLAIVIVVSTAVGVSAPRWPTSWLRSTPIPLHLWSWETPARYRSWGVRAYARLLPEMGATFGGMSKASLPGNDRLALGIYQREAVRGEWVHWISIASALIAFAFVPWFVALLVLGLVVLGNAPFLFVLRYNRIRLGRLLAE